MTHAILAVDDDPVQRRLLEAAIVKMGHNAVKAENGPDALDILTGPHGKAISAVILDLVMPEMNGMEVLEKMRDLGINKPVIVQTAQGGIDTVVNAMRSGAFDFVVKPIAFDKLETTLNNAIRYEGSAQQAPARTRRASKTGFTFKDIVSKSPAMVKVMAMGEKAARSGIPVLIEGESGVGKELVARAIQGSSDRAGRPFITVNCGALPENLVESILFGHEKGAFTGASEKHVGKFEEANGGTLFLDEIGELPFDLQVKLLRAIQEGEIDPIGARKPVKIDIRLISATNRNLLDEVRAGRFREDLYYRLNVLPMTVPPLRERKEDIPALVYHFVKRMAAEERKQNISAINPKVLEVLSAYDWPGNIRELENAIFRAIVLCDREELTLDEFPQIVSQMPDFKLEDHAGQPAEPVEIGMITPLGDDFLIEDEPQSTAGGSVATHQATSPVSVRPPEGAELPATGLYGYLKMISDEGQIRPINDMEREIITFAIEIYNGRMSEVARRLGIGRSTLYRKLKEYGLEETAGEKDTGK
ncbi:MAG: sigma-54-dependent Fis family transcriptional regulator [Nitratireductor sp.]|nr:sigma-54-dependent Fis family transcriptional regulator [Nitratireductor sp.]